MQRETGCNKGPEFVGNECFGDDMGPAIHRPPILMSGSWLRTAEIAQEQSIYIRFIYEGILIAHRLNTQFDRLSYIHLPATAEMLNFSVY